MKKLSVVIPCYNEEKNIPLILDRFASVMQRDDIEVVLVNNGSKDNSAAVLDRLVPEYPFARTVTVPENQGYGYGILYGLERTNGKFIGWTHADMQTDPYDIIRGLEIIESSHEPEKVYAKGLRKGRPLFDTFFTTGMGIFETIYMGTPLRDINAQPNLFPKSFYESWDHPPHDFSLDLYALYMARIKNLSVVRFPVVFPERIHGESSWNTGLRAKWKFIKRTLDFSFKLKARIQKQ